MNLTIYDSRCFLMWENGTPLFYLGDTALVSLVKVFVTRLLVRKRSSMRVEIISARGAEPAAYQDSHFPPRTRFDSVLDIFRQAHGLSFCNPWIVRRIGNVVECTHVATASNRGVRWS